jgi:hypothetical protein
MLPTLQKERLVLRPLQDGDLSGLADLHAEESFWRYPLGRGQTRKNGSTTSTSEQVAPTKPSATETAEHPS